MRAGARLRQPYPPPAGDRQEECRAPEVPQRSEERRATVHAEPLCPAREPGSGHDTGRPRIRRQIRTSPAGSRG